MSVGCPHERTSPVDAGHECVACGTVLDRPRLRAITGGGHVPGPQRRRELLAEVRRLLHPEGSDQ